MNNDEPWFDIYIYYIITFNIYIIIDGDMKNLIKHKPQVKNVET